MSRVTIHTDGSCLPSGGPGGWACTIEQDGETIELSGGHPGPTTNNRMEIQGAIEALRYLAPGASVDLKTDSKYLRNGGCQWIALWNKRGWKTLEGEPVKNADLWRELEIEKRKHRVNWIWVKSHQDNGNNNDRCDALANNQRNAHKKQSK